MPRRSLFAVIGPALAVCLVAALPPAPGAAQEKPAPAASPAPAPADGKYFELRIYTAAPGKLEALQTRFREHTTKLFEKHGIKNVGYWTAVDEKHQGRLYYILAYPDKASRDGMWEAFAKDPEWTRVARESETNGKLVDAVEQVFLSATDYSAIR